MAGSFCSTWPIPVPPPSNTFLVDKLGISLQTLKDPVKFQFNHRHLSFSFQLICFPCFITFLDIISFSNVLNIRSTVFIFLLISLSFIYVLSVGMIFDVFYAFLIFWHIFSSFNKSILYTNSFRKTTLISISEDSSSIFVFFQGCHTVISVHLQT